MGEPRWCPGSLADSQQEAESSAGNKRFPDGFDSGPSALQCGCECWCYFVYAGCLSVSLGLPKLGLCGLVLGINPRLVLYS